MPARARPAERLLVRDAGAGDAAACAALYAPSVLETAASFELEPPTPEEVARRIAAAQVQHAWLVAVQEVPGDAGGRVVGYAAAHAYAERPAYRWACETSVYVEQGHRRTGAGRLLYEALLARLAARGLRRVAASIALPNPASTGLHEALGFRRVGTSPRIGHKLGAWHDVAHYQLDLDPRAGAGSDPDAPPAPMS